MIDYTTYEIYKPNPDKKMKFMLGSDWFLEISKSGMKFNREMFPDHTVDDFAREFIKVLEQAIPIKFIDNRIDQQLAVS